MLKLTDHPRGHILNAKGRDRTGRVRYRAQIQHLKVGDVLAGFGEVLEWQEVEPAHGWRHFRMRTPAATVTRPAYLYYYVTSLAD
jgi:hypothetical protein